MKGGNVWRISQVVYENTACKIHDHKNTNLTYLWMLAIVVICKEIICKEVAPQSYNT